MPDTINFKYDMSKYLNNFIVILFIYYIKYIFKID